MVRKIEKMYELFGIDHNNKCKSCMHFHGGKNEYKKCSVYGRTSSEASDWNMSYIACGLFNKEYEGDVPIIRTLRRETEESQIAGQISIFDLIDS